MIKQNNKNLPKRLGIWAAAVGAILLIPLLAKAPWTLFDFFFAGMVLYSCAAVYEFATKKMNNNWHRMGVALAILGFLVLVLAWAAAGPD